MYRSASWSRVNDQDYYSQSSSPSSKGTAGLRMSSSFELSSGELPMYDQIAEMAKKEKARLKFAENAVHIIPLVLIICAFILWFFSSPEVDMMTRDSIAARIEGLTIEGDIENDSDGTQTNVLPILDFGDVDSPKQTDHLQASNKLENTLL
ncbi:uncharacterized protein LOC107414051 [Ziziphus jujuba]|uniref:Uncharacterized protein LOC107414051 n=2 Tax=Ziziphus jujuba TaxID=326968 RepID=A0A6P3ZVT7_ZIZJJ|nr:uncharacterized protein LOC107414051 [Ziziphus jujuba]KAH7537780.1 hypothetical protein FEM48_Zijuj03G0129600 [Ziziphus jujuba var. spinosa]